MGAIFAAVAMLQALITGDCLLCETCLASGTTQCSGIFKQCPPDVTHCVKGLENTKREDSVFVTAFKACLNPSDQAACGRELHFQNSLFSYQISRTCCDSDFCNKGDVEAPVVDETPNGYKCDERFSDQSSDSCTPTGEAQCTGEQNTCHFFSGKVIVPGDTLKSYSMKGCVTPDYCQLFHLAATQIYVDDVLCIPAKKL
uniref:Sodefrin-like factor n=1 Tax=Ichthyosaura alpestris TaxID=54263 RepID=A0A0F7JH26_ICHAP|nr:sodefrin precursor-like factor [Ichthyosaura alpestris]